MARTRIPLAGSIVTRTSSFTGTRDQMFQNCFSYQISDQMTGGSRIITQRRPGFISAYTMPGTVDSSANGACIWYGKTSQPVFSFNQNSGTNCGVYYYSGTQIGANIAGTATCSFIGDTSISGTANLYGIFTDSGSGANELWFYPDGGAWTQVVDAEFPSGIVGTAAEMDGYIFVCTTAGKLWNSDLNSISSWSANNFIDANLNPDGAYAVARSQKNIAVFGYGGIQFFKNNGNPSGSPLIDIPEAAQMIGMRYSTSLPLVDGDDIYFTGTMGTSAKYAAFKIRGTQITKISTPEVDKLLESGAFICIGSANFGGYVNVFFRNISNAPYVLCYQPEINRWWKFYPIDSSSTYSMNLSRLLGYSASGLTYASTPQGIVSSSFTSPTYTDYDGALTTNFVSPMVIQTQTLDMGTDDWKFCSRLTLIGDKQSSATTVTVSWSDDDAVTFSPGVTIDMASATPFITRLGRFKRRVWKFTNTTNTPLRLEAFELEYEVGV